jgi:hypothetical protein
MLSSLPTELIREILESTVPRTFHSTTYNERQSTLRSLSLVSKIFRSIAQPLLLGIVWIKSAQDLVRLPLSRSGEGGGDLAGHLRCVIVEVAVEDILRFRRNQTAVEDSLRMFSSVTSLTMSTYNTRTIDLALLSSFQSKLFPSDSASADLIRLVVVLSQVCQASRSPATNSTSCRLHLSPISDLSRFGQSRTIS